MVERMDAGGRRRWKSARSSAYALLLLVTVAGVLLMHSGISTEPVSGTDNMAMASVHSAAPDAFTEVTSGGQDCPSAHQLMHPCVGTVSSSPELASPMVSVDVDIDYTSSTQATLAASGQVPSDRAPPWSLWELDKSVTLRV